MSACNCTTKTSLQGIWLISLGVRSPQEAQKVETRTVQSDELPVTEQDWDAWGSDNENDVVTESSHTNGGSQADHDLRDHTTLATRSSPQQHQAVEDDVDDAWGWNEDEDVVEQSVGEKQQQNKQALHHDRTRVRVNNRDSAKQVTMSENYWTSGLPQPITDIITEIYEDGARLLQPEYVFDL